VRQWPRPIVYHQRVTESVQQPPFDAVLLVSFGGPQGVEDIRPFLANVLRGRRVPPARLEEVAHHYELFDGVSPITELTERQAAALGARLASEGPALPVYVGMRNWHPFLADTLRKMADDGVRRTVGVILAAQRSYSSCEQYRRNVDAARYENRQAGFADVRVTYVPDWHVAEGFLAACAARIAEARDALASETDRPPRIVFTAHSIPTRMADGSRYVTQLRESARAVASRLGTDDWELVFQSRSGRPTDPWLEPDICDYLRTERERGLEAVVIHPIGFVADHIEVLYDLDREAAEVCQEVGLPMRRAAAVNDHPRFIDTLVELVRGTVTRYRGCPLPLVAETQQLEG
jgi:ferrochelatase